MKEKKILCFHHSDLDGIGVKLLSIVHCQLAGFHYETHKCDYGNVNDIVKQTLEGKTPEEIAEIIIGDISVNDEVAEYLNDLYNAGIPVILRDHHATAMWLNKCPWAVVAEVDEQGVPICGTKLIYQEFSEEFKNTPVLKLFADTVNDWDTWLWKEKNNLDARDFNAIFQILGEDDFTDYCMGVFLSKIELFTDDSRMLINAHTRSVKKTAANCEKYMQNTVLSVINSVGREITLNTGVVFCNTDISDVSDIILTNHPELDVLMLVSLPRSISLRTQKNLDIPLGDLAKLLTGSGGGHPKSAGATISYKKFKKIFNKSFDILSDHNKLSMTLLEDDHERG